MSYYTLVTALPDLPPLAKCKQMPISRIALDRRLTMLSEEDQKQLKLAESLYHFGAEQPASLPDQKLVYQWQSQLSQIQSEPVRQCIANRLEWQSFLAAMRQRQQGDKGPEQFFGFGRWTTRIRQHWHEPTFGLETALPLLTELHPLLQKGAAGEVEYQINHHLWQQLLQIERSHHFTIETVICFVLRWELAEKQIRNNADQALAAFDTMAEGLIATPAIRQHIASAFEELS
ncbi:hypothetical protein [Oceanospirillum sediminis]|uniref:DUF2764 family protein n=1 Tax=Oceanospirillum sediminis TaxID=2760088 RepID=A0A839ISC8_9GAMM|nr:hypothetical protein [Oceanospirillum sediminis]MBB1487570.1 hypothetical protein [Oceanospirillum sediminis]